MKVNIKKYIDNNDIINLFDLKKKFKNIKINELNEIDKYLKDNQKKIIIPEILTKNINLEEMFLTKEVSDNFKDLNKSISNERENSYLSYLKNSKVLKQDEENLIAKEMENGKDYTIDLFIKYDFLMKYFFSLELLFLKNNRKTNKLFNLSYDDQQNKISLKDKDKKIKSIYRKIKKMYDYYLSEEYSSEFSQYMLRNLISNEIHELKPTFVFVREILSFYKNSLLNNEMIDNKIKILEHKIPLFSENKIEEHNHFISKLNSIDFYDVLNIIKDKERLNIYLSIKRLIDSKNTIIKINDKEKIINEHNNKLALHKINTTKNIFILYNLKLVIKISKNYKNEFLDFFDLVQEGNLGLIKAIEKFDYSKGFKFSTYASWWIKQQIKRTINEKTNTIKIPVHLLDLRKKINKFKLSYLSSHGKEPSEKTILKEFNITKEKYLTISEINMTKSIYTPINKEQDSKETLLDTIIDKKVNTEEINSRNNIKNDIKKILKEQLSEKEYIVIKQRFGLNDDNSEYTLEEISKPLGISKERVRQIENSALKKLRHPKIGLLLQEFIS